MGIRTRRGSALPSLLTGAFYFGLGFAVEPVAGITLIADSLRKMSFPCKKDSVISVKVGSCGPSSSGSRSGILGQLAACEGWGPCGTLAQPALSSIKLSSKTLVFFIDGLSFLVCCFLQLLLGFLVGEDLAQAFSSRLPATLIQLALHALGAVFIPLLIAPCPKPQKSD